MKSKKSVSVRPVVNAALINNYVQLRTQWLTKLLDTGKNIEQECGHPEFIDISDYTKKWERGDVAGRVISLYPEESWAKAPIVYETEEDTDTEFEEAWNRLETRFRITSILLRADILSGIGRFGVILLGINDGLDLDQPVAAVEADLLKSMLETPPVKNAEAPKFKLLYLRTFDESLVTIKELENDPKNPRFGQPRIYEIRVWKDSVNQNGTISAVSDPISPGSKVKVIGTTMNVHWTRIIHLADNRTTDEIFGTPRLQKCWNRILDLHKIAGGSGEMFWKGGFPGISLETLPSDEPVQLDKAATKDEMEEYYNGLKRYIALEGMTAKSLAPNISDPIPHMELHLRLISIALACPWRVLMGSEVGQLASGQDMIAWSERMKKRQNEYNEPHILRPFVDRLLACGILPPTKLDDDGRSDYLVYWPELRTASEEEKAMSVERRTNALAKFATTGADQVIPLPFYLELIMGYTREEVNAILDKLGDRALETDPDEDEAATDEMAPGDNPEDDEDVSEAP